MMEHLFSPRAWGSMAESETYAHLEHLRIAGDAVSSWHDGLLCYDIDPSLPRQRSGANGRDS
jgi:hypothetical protein